MRNTRPICVAPAENFRITDDHLGEGGPKAKFQANVEAIKLLKSWRKPPSRQRRNSRKSFPGMWAGAALPMPLTPTRKAGARNMPS